MRNRIFLEKGDNRSAGNDVSTFMEPEGSQEPAGGHCPEQLIIDS
jgi:hypothetical protein